MPVYVFYGEDDYRRQQASRALQKQVVQPAFAAISHKVLVRPGLQELVETLNAGLFNLGGDTLYEVQDFPYLTKAIPDGESAALESLKETLKELEPSKHVVFIAPKIDRKLKFPKWVTQQPFVNAQEFKAFAFWQTQEATSAFLGELRGQQIQMKPDAAQWLVENLGMDFQQLMSEAQKLAIYAGERAITLADVQKLSNHSENVFQMLDAWLFNAPRAQVFSTLEEVLLHQHPLQLYALIQNHLHHVFKLRYWQSAGVSEAEIAERTKKHPFKIKKDLQAFARIPLPRLEMLRSKATTLEWQFKTGQIQDRIAVEMLLSA